jgi:hypothetical protein
VLLHLQDQLLSLIALNPKGVENVGHAVGGKLGVHDRAEHLDDFARNFVGSYFHGERSVVR